MALVSYIEIRDSGLEDLEDWNSKTGGRACLDGDKDFLIHLSMRMGWTRCRGAVMMHDGQGLIRSLWSMSGFMDVAGWTNAWMNGWAYREIGVYAYILAGESETLMFGCSESIGACMRIYRPFSSGSGPHCDGRHATPILSRIPPLNFISVFLSLQMTKFANLRPPPQ